jgi:hypothetical protein
VFEIEKEALLPQRSFLGGACLGTVYLRFVEY